MREAAAVFGWVSGRDARERHGVECTPASHTLLAGARACGVVRDARVAAEIPAAS
jgi:hypothetical protein